MNIAAAKREGGVREGWRDLLVLAKALTGLALVFLGFCGWFLVAVLIYVSFKSGPGKALEIVLADIWVWPMFAAALYLAVKGA